jgi:NOL1/NOP2/fmu family ribosome biogenesis protein
MAIGRHDSILVVVQAANGDPYKIRTTRSGFQAGTGEKQGYKLQINNEVTAETIIQDVGRRLRSCAIGP